LLRNITIQKSIRLRIFFTFIVLYFLVIPVFSQIKVTGTVFDKSNINYVEAVSVFSTGGKIVLTDSMGRYSIQTKMGDSLYFVYNNKPTQKFAVSSIANTEQFDISIHVPVKSRIKMLQEVIVYSKNYKLDSAENRETYAKFFNFKKSSFQTSIAPSGSVGLDANELINMFRFRRRKQMQQFQNWLEKEEQEKYVNYRFSKVFVRRITQLTSPALDTFLVWYRPSYRFTTTSSLVDFNQYVLNASYHFRNIMGLPQIIVGNKEEE
jgi:hypothetical protein